MIIGNIITDNNTEYNLLKKFSRLDLVDNDKPTLILGFSVVKNIYPSFEVTNRHLGKNIYWTFNRLEKRDLYEQDLYNFKLNCVTKITNDTKYLFVDLLQFKLSTLKRIIYKINELPQIYLYETIEMLYLGYDNLVFGLDRKQLKFTGVNEDKLLDKLKNKNLVIINNNFKDGKQEIFDLLDSKNRFITRLAQASNFLN